MPPRLYCAAAVSWLAAASYVPAVSVVMLLQSIQGPRDEILVAFFSKDLKTASPEEKDLVAAVAAQDADAVQEALKHVSCVAHAEEGRWGGLAEGALAVAGRWLGAVAAPAEP